MSDIRKPITLRFPERACARVKLWLVGDSKGRKRDSYEVWSPVPNEVAGLLKAVAFAMARPDRFRPRVLAMATELAQELMKGG